VASLNRRQEIVTSNDTTDQFANRVQVMPINSRVGRLYPCVTLIDIDHRKCKAMAE